ncbi:amidohydrolase family protein [uncultured Aquimarina sp.]|uniref:amidohydrolase family protein n=1 Tax=uncultured Aquimarina sp. TaxID=575652 RepID=UPI0026340BA3|nr:amidohydrolase family protein [uncultured Aquimarina sp.]
MKRRSIKKWIIGTLLIVMVISIGSCIGVKSQINHHLGAKTEIVDASVFKTLSNPIAITNVNVLSADCSKMTDSLTVLIKDGKIQSITEGNVISNEYTVIDGTGKYLIPGLIDTHAHLKKSKNDLLLYLANGVTGIAEMFGTKQHLAWRKEAEGGTLSPKIYVATTKVGSRKGLMRKIRKWFGAQHNYTTVKKAQKAVTKYKEQGYDAIKLSSFLSPEIYHAIVKEAKKQNIPTVGHLTYDVSLDDFYDSGQTQLAHIEEITKSTMTEFGGLYTDNTEDYLKYLNENADAIAIKLKENKIVISSTVWIIESFPKQKFDLDNFIKEIELEYVNPGIVEGSRMGKGWLPGNNSYENLEIKNDPERSKEVKVFWDAYAKAIHVMARALLKHNVTIIAGTDSNGACTVPGFSLHDELTSLSNVGLNNEQVLQTATRNAGEWMQNNTGRIEVGFDADLVLLNNNPLQDINNTRKIQSVIINGNLIDRSTLDKMLESVKNANDRSRKVSIDTHL